jgi:hypothetical protein
MPMFWDEALPRPYPYVSLLLCVESFCVSLRLINAEGQAGGMRHFPQRMLRKAAKFLI